MNKAEYDLTRSISEAIKDVLTERQRQIGVEGWTEDHDDKHGLGDMAMADACYAAHAACREAIERGDFEPYSQLDAAQRLVGRMWPWDKAWWKPKDTRRDLVRAAALLIAEIERIDRTCVHAVTDTTYLNGLVDRHRCRSCGKEWTELPA